ncbi:MAG: hypothetical protein AAFV86_05170 [Pseudomonadota bacterium]
MRHHPNDPAPPPWDSVLDAGERLLWTGRPGFSLLAFCAWAFGVGFLALWLALPVMALTAGEVDRTVTIVASVFLVLGGIALAAQLLSALDWLRMRYALTDRRALILSGLLSRRLISWPITAESPVEHQQGRRRGSIVFGVDRAPGKRKRWVGFFHIAEHDTVMRLVRALQTGPPRR